MKCNTQNRECHAERSEASLCPSSQTLPLRKLRASAHCAQGDTTWPILIVKNLHCAVAHEVASLFVKVQHRACSTYIRSHYIIQPLIELLRKPGCANYLPCFPHSAPSGN